MKIIEAENLKKEFNGFVAVDEVDFHINKGEIFGFLGPNGAGKTTTINMLTGMVKISAGKVKLMGEDYTHNAKKAQAMMGIVPDESNLYEELSGLENLTFCGALYGMERKHRAERAARLLQQFGLMEAANKPFKAYSKGMKRKLTIAAGIIHQPEILFLDEPTTGIDVAFARQIRNLIVELHKKGTTIFLTTHYIEEAERLCQRLAFIVRGKIVKEGTVEELMKDTQGENVVNFTLGGDFSNIKEEFEERFPGYDFKMGKNNNEVSIHSASTFALFPLVQLFEEKDFPVYEAKIVRPSLEDVFVKVTGIELQKMQDEQGQKGKKGQKGGRARS
ncbi:MAG: ABC transporter ATP-binding protein [Firmicutes bacterium]|nr:ABC transporter ATP-binding protein [Bacillota bacterium]